LTLSQSESLKSFSGSSYALSLTFSSSNKTTLITSFFFQKSVLNQH